VKFVRSRRGIAAVAALLLILFLYRPGVHQLRDRIATSIGSALRRRVALDNVRIHVLPRPGFDLEGLIIYDDPAFSAEPMIRAQEVSAAIRFRSLLRGRLEIATLSATEPSINIVRNSEGRWNLASLIQRNAQIPVAPTQKSASESRPAFPYLEASNARINFKIGQEKKSYALTDADVALWQDSENSWGARMKAQPVRTDVNLSDTGLLQIDATWQRAANLHQTQMRLLISWNKGQLGQITKLLTGRDRGWRGTVDLTANLTGTPETLVIENRAAVDGFRRYDILDNRTVRLAAACTAHYNITRSTLSDLLCQSPVSAGRLLVRGEMASLKTVPTYDLTLSAEKVPVASLLEFLHETKQALPADLRATGQLDAEFHAVRDEDGPVELTGSGAAADVRLTSNGGKDIVAIGNIPLALVNSAQCCKPGRNLTERAKELAKKEQEPGEAHVRIGPATMAVNASAPMSTGGWISTGGYRFFLRGDAELTNLFRLESALGLPAARPAAEGSAKLDVSVAGPWQGFAAPTALGTAQLKNVRAETRGFNTPIEIASAAVVLGPEVFSIQKLQVRTGSTHWSGSVTAPRHCAPACVFQFDLSADQLSASDLSEWFTPHSAKRPWYRILNANEQQGPSPLLPLQAQGNLQVTRLELDKVFVTQVATHMALDHGKVSLTALRGQLLHGSHLGNWSIDATEQPLRYRGNGTLQNISLDQIGGLMNDAWIAGTADGSFDLQTSGESFRDLLAHSDAKLQFVMRNGSFAHVEVPGSRAPMPVHRFAGNLRLQKAEWELTAGKLESRDGIYQVSGKAAPESELSFVVTRGDAQSWNLTGTLDRLRVATNGHSEVSGAATDTKAELKP